MRNVVGGFLFWFDLIGFDLSLTENHFKTCSGEKLNKNETLCKVGRFLLDFGLG